MGEQNQTILADQSELELVVFAPNGRDADVLCKLVQAQQETPCTAVDSLDAVVGRIAHGAGAIVLTSEVLDVPTVEKLNASLQKQPKWSDIPIIVLTRPKHETKDSGLVSVLRSQANTMLVERPAQVMTMMSAVRAALRARRRQYAMRGHLQEIRDSDAQLRFALQAGQMGTWSFDFSTRKIDCSDGVYTILGLAKSDQPLSIDAARARVHPDDVKSVHDRFIDATRDRVEFLNECRIVRPDGSTLWVEVRARISFDRDGDPQQVAGVVIDVDQRRRNEEQLRVSHQVAEAANAAKDRFLAVLSHELRTPLTPVLAMAQMLQEEPTLPAEMREPVNMIRRNMELEARLIDDLLDLTRIVRDKLELHRTTVSLAQVVRSAIAICQADADQKGVRIIDADLCEHDTLVGDPTRLQQVFWNLLKNAIKFTPLGGTIRIEMHGDSNTGLIVTVADTGVGITPEVVPTIFNAFEQGGREMTRAFGGLGLGLTISKAILEAHGATISAVSEGHMRGTTFTIKFPGQTSAANDAPDRSKGRQRHAAVPSQRILLVEDHPDTGNVMCHLLENLGHEVQLTESIAEATEALALHSFDLIVSDLGLPDGSGLSIMRDARHGRNIPGIALSGYGTPEDIERSLAAGFSQHLTKPVDIQQLKAAIARVCGEAAALSR